MYSSFVFNVIFEWNLRYVSRNTPPDGFLYPRDTIFVPWGFTYLAHVLLLGIPMIVAAVALRKSARLGWQISLGVVTMQAVMLAANVVSALFGGRGAWRALGTEVTAALFIGGIVMLLANLFLLWRAAEVLESNGR